MDRWNYSNPKRILLESSGVCPQAVSWVSDWQTKFSLASLCVLFFLVMIHLPNCICSKQTNNSGARNSIFSKILGAPLLRRIPRLGLLPMVCQSIISQFNHDNFAKGESWLCAAVCNFLKNDFKAKYHDFFKAGRATFRLPVAKQCQVNMQYISYWGKSFLKEYCFYIDFFYVTFTGLSEPGG